MRQWQHTGHQHETPRASSTSVMLRQKAQNFCICMFRQEAHKWSESTTETWNSHQVYAQKARNLECGISGPFLCKRHRNAKIWDFQPRSKGDQTTGPFDASFQIVSTQVAPKIIQRSHLSLYDRPPFSIGIYRKMKVGGFELMIYHLEFTICLVFFQPTTFELVYPHLPSCRNKCFSPRK